MFVFNLDIFPPSLFNSNVNSGGNLIKSKKSQQKRQLIFGEKIYININPWIFYWKIQPNIHICIQTPIAKYWHQYVFMCCIESFILFVLTTLLSHKYKYSMNRMSSSLQIWHIFDLLQMKICCTGKCIRHCK